MTKRVVLVSDFHMGPGAQWNVEDFFRDDLVRHLAGHRSSTLDTDIVLLGDTFDIWQTLIGRYDYDAESADQVRVEYTTEDEVAKLETILLNHREAVSALDQLSRMPRTKVRFVIGNHDHSLVSPDVQALLRRYVTGEVDVPVVVDYPELGLWAEHGCQYDHNNTYPTPFSDFKWQQDCPGYYFVSLFWNRLEHISPNIENSPAGWKKVFYYIFKGLFNPRLAAKAIKFWRQYKRDSRVQKHISLTAAEMPGAPDLLVAGLAAGGRLFSSDDTVEQAYREMFHTDPDIRHELESMLPIGQVVPPPAPSPTAQSWREQAADESLPRSLSDESDVDQSASELLDGQRDPTERPQRLNGYKCVVFGHTHAPKIQQLSAHQLYANTGTWLGRKPRCTTVIVEPRGNGTHVTYGETNHSGGINIGQEHDL